MKTNVKFVQTQNYKKKKKKSFRPSKNKFNNIFDLIQNDLARPIESSFSIIKYFYIILDDFSRFEWVIFLIENKSDTFRNFLIWFK